MLQSRARRALLVAATGATLVAGTCVLADAAHAEDLPAAVTSFGHVSPVSGAAGATLTVGGATADLAVESALVAWTASLPAGATFADTAGVHPVAAPFWVVEGGTLAGQCHYASVRELACNVAGGVLHTQVTLPSLAVQAEDGVRDATLRWTVGGTQAYGDDLPITTTASSVGIPLHWTSAPPVVTVDLQDVTVTEGQAATFTAAGGDGSVSWESRAAGQPGWSVVAGATSGSLVVQSTLADDGSQYRATFTNDGGAVTTREATLTVVPVPAVVPVPVNGSGTTTGGTTAVPAPVGAVVDTPEPGVVSEVLAASGSTHTVAHRTTGSARSGLSGLAETGSDVLPVAALAGALAGLGAMFVVANRRRRATES